jgi:hypothetical protein
MVEKVTDRVTSKEETRAEETVACPPYSVFVLIVDPVMVEKVTSMA